MTPRDRVRAALTWQRPDRVPMGEFELTALEPHLRQAGVRPDAVGAVAGPSGWQDRLARLAGPEGGGAFVWVVVDGPFQGLAAELGLEEALRAMRRPDRPALLRERAGRAAACARQALSLGADGIVIADDVAYSGGLMLPWGILAGELRPLWAGLVGDIGGSGPGCEQPPPEEAARPLIVFHCDSAPVDLIELAAEAGFDAFHPLEPRAAPAEVSQAAPAEVSQAAPAASAPLSTTISGYLERFRGRLGLWGGLPLDLLARTGPDGGELETLARDLGRLGRDGGLVVGTASGAVPAWVSAERLAGAYAAAIGA